MAAAERARAKEAQQSVLADALVEAPLAVDFQPADAVEEDAITTAKLMAENKLLLDELVKGASTNRQQQISARQSTLASSISRIRGQHAGKDLSRLNRIAAALNGDYNSFSNRGQVVEMPAALQPMLFDFVDSRDLNAEYAASVARDRAEQRERRGQAADAQYFNEFYNADTGEIAFWAFLLLGATLSFGLPRGLGKLEKDGTLVMAGRRLSLKSVSGEILESQKRTEVDVKVTQSGGHGSMVGGTGYVTPVNTTIETERTTFDTLFVEDDAGQEHALELKNFDLQARSGNRLSVIGAGPYGHFAAYNHSTGKGYFQAEAIREMLAPSFLWVLLAWALMILASAVPLYFLNRNEGFLSGVLTAIVLCSFVGFRQIVARSRAGIFRMGKAPAAILDRIAEKEAGTVSSVGV